MKICLSFGSSVPKIIISEQPQKIDDDFQIFKDGSKWDSTLLADQILIQDQ